jgi:hypothetical protein
MLRAREFQCPSCETVLGRTARVHVSVGRPFEECPRCRALAARPATNEWDLLGPGEKAYWLADRVAPFFVLGLVPALGYWMFAFREGSGELPMLVALLCAGPILAGMLPLSTALQSIRRSRGRMADPMYRARLIEFSRRASPRS